MRKMVRKIFTQCDSLLLGDQSGAHYRGLNRGSRIDRDDSGNEANDQQKNSDDAELFYGPKQRGLDRRSGR